MIKAKRNIKEHHTFKAALTTAPDKVVEVTRERIVINVGQWTRQRPFTAKRIGGCVVIERLA